MCIVSTVVMKLAIEYSCELNYIRVRSSLGSVSNNCGIGILKGKRAETFRVSKDRWDPIR
jgi:hypothetical protein